MVAETTPEKIRKQQWKHLIDNGTLKSFIINDLQGSSTFYTVPTGKVFYLNGFYISWEKLLDTTNVDSVWFQIQFVINLWQLPSKPAIGATGEFYLPLTHPIKLNAGEELHFQFSGANRANITAYGNGYEIDA